MHGTTPASSRPRSFRSGPSEQRIAATGQAQPSTRFHGERTTSKTKDTAYNIVCSARTVTAQPCRLPCVHSCRLCSSFATSRERYMLGLARLFSLRFTSHNFPLCFEFPFAPWPCSTANFAKLSRKYHVRLHYIYPTRLAVLAGQNLIRFVRFLGGRQ